MKYLIFKIIGILGLVATPFISKAYEEVVKPSYSVFKEAYWFDLYSFLLVIFFIITLAGFSRSIAKIKAFIDFHTDFDDDPDLDGYPKLRVFSIIKKIILITSVVGVVISAILTGFIPFFKDNIYYIVTSALCLVFAITLINIIACLIMKIIPLKLDWAVFYAVIAFVLYYMLPYWGCEDNLKSIILSPIIALSLLNFLFVTEEYISADELFDWLYRDEYESFYKKLCDKENKQKEKEKEKLQNTNNDKPKKKTKNSTKKTNSVKNENS
ncbi:MAG: hypothetical protein IJX17_05650 [Clostridia bacterium]|nr:hypothetical protein [Clostridia bacterium]